jgi:hypothetical protein
MRRTALLVLALTSGAVLAVILFTGAAGTQEKGKPGQVVLPSAKPVPRLQVIPLPYEQASFQRDGIELTRYHFGKTLHRPFLFPVVGPGGRFLTRLGHPLDPVGHSHHNSVWVSHNNVNGDDFWGDQSGSRIVHQRLVRYTDGSDEASLVAVNAWIGKEGQVHLLERRRVTVLLLPEREWLLILDLQFEAPKKPATLGKTSFGLVGVRMAKTIGVRDGGGLIRNSEGNVNEQGPNGVFHKRARWVDFSGPITADAAEGITLFDHPSNPNHPSHFHVRDDGFMTTSLTQDKEITVQPGQLLRLRYGLYVHAGVPEAKALDGRWNTFAKTAITDVPMK